MEQINFAKGVDLFRSHDGAVLLDVRTRGEYAQGHIPGSHNLPLAKLGRVGDIIPEKDTPVYVHCLSGQRSRQSAVLLREMGYHNVMDIGGIAAYEGLLEA